MQVKNDARIYNIVFYASLAVSILLIAIMLIAPNMKTTGSAAQQNGRTSQLANPSVAVRESDDLSPDSKIVPDNTQDTNSTIIVLLTSNKLSELLTAALSDTLPLTQVQVEYLDEGLIRLSGTLDKNDLLALVEKSDAGLSETASKALNYVPQTMPLSTDLSITAASGNVIITPSKLTIAQIELPVALLPATSGEIIGDVVEQVLSEVGIRLEEVKIEDGVLKLSGS